MTCQQCGMVCNEPTEYHPYAACLMFWGCNDGDIVRANLAAILEYASDTDAAPAEGGEHG